MVQTPPRPKADRASAPSGGEQRPDPASVPERPALAPGVELSGELADSGFERQQWLVQRDGRFIQLSERLYRILEQANGQRTLQEIAASVSQTGDRRLSSEQVGRLIATQLIPRGLIIQTDGTVVEATGGTGAARSPMALNMRMAMVSPRLIEPATRALRILFLPAVVAAVVVAVAGAYVWLYAVHGVAQAVRHLLYTPALILVLFGVIIISTIFHEFGHATALAYGGGKVRGMGAGFYLIYPAFYTDVTDNYRLGRWARLRTDLGGFYFNLIFALGLLGLYARTRWEFLLLIVLFINLDIVRQSIPFVRLDGYWALADLTGLPDFLGQIGPFLRSTLPFLGGGSSRVTALKGWVKAVLAAYVVIVLPLMALLVFLGLKNLPRVMATTWDSGLKQVAAGAKAAGAGDVLGLASAALQVVALALPALGLCFMVYSLGRRGLGWLRRWSAESPGRRAVGALGTVAALALLVALWLPQLPFGHGRPGPLYAVLQAGPIGPSERGTLPGALTGLLTLPSAPSTPLVPVLPGNGGAVGAAPSSALPPPGTPAASSTTPQTLPGVSAPVPAGSPAPLAPAATVLPAVAPPVATALPSVTRPAGTAPVVGSVQTFTRAATGAVPAVATAVPTVVPTVATAVPTVVQRVATTAASVTQQVVSTASGATQQVSSTASAATRQVSSAVSTFSQATASAMAVAPVLP